MSESPLNSFPHLNDDVAEIATRSDEERLFFISQDRFIPHPKAEAILDDLEMLYRSANSVRPQGRLLIGLPLMGKSTLIDQFVKNHRASDDPDGESVHCPVISVQYPDVPSQGIYPEILRALNVKTTKMKSNQDMRKHCYELLHMVDCRMVIIDEFHHVVAAKSNDREQGINGVKFLMNDLKRPIVIAGTHSCANIFKRDPQFSSRLYRLDLNPFKNDDQFALLLVGFESLIPIRNPSNFHENSALRDKIHRLTNGITGYVSDLLNKAARIAITEGSEVITEAEIDAAGWQMPCDLTSAEFG